MKFEEYLKLKKHNRSTFWRRLRYWLFPLDEWKDLHHDVKLIEESYVDILHELEGLR